MRTLGSALGAILDFFIRLLLLIALPALLLVAIVAAVEVDARHHALRDTTMRLTQLQNAAAAGATSVARMNPGENTDVGSALVSVERERRAAADLMRVGDSEAGAAFRERMDDVRAGLFADQAATNHDLPGWVEWIIDIGKWLVYGVLYLFNAALLLPGALNSMLLLLLGMVAAALLGALIVAARRREIRYLRAIIAGIAAAVFIFLLLMVARTLIIIELTGQPLYINAYAAMFLALLGGLAADKLLTVSSLMTDAAYERLTYSRDDAAAERRERRKRKRKARERAAKRRERAWEPRPPEDTDTAPRRDIEA